jgi:hypothetical protein
VVQPFAHGLTNHQPPALDMLDACEDEEGEILSSSKARKKDRTA